MTIFPLGLTLASIFALTALAWLLRRVLPPRLCPLCAGVAGTWMGLLGAHWAGLEVDLRLPALLLGGSVVGLAGAAERVLAGRTPDFVLAWKTAFVTAGFGTAYAVLLPAWPAVALGVVLLATLLGVPWLTAPGAADRAQNDGQARLLSSLKNCC